MKQYIKLENAHITQHSSGEKTSDWSIEANETNERLIKFPSKYSEKEMMAILDFARDYEHIAWNAGIRFGRDKAKEIWEYKLEQAEVRIEYMKKENERLANALQNVYVRQEG